MRRSRLLRASSNQTICSLCACRIPQGAALVQRNGFHSTSTPAQDHASQYGGTSNASGWDLPDATSEARDALLQMRKARQEKEATEKKREQDLADALETQKIFGNHNSPAKETQAQKQPELQAVEQTQRPQEPQSQPPELPQTPQVEQIQQLQESPVGRVGPIQEPQDPEPVQAKQTQPPQPQAPRREQKEPSRQAHEQQQLRTTRTSVEQTPTSPLNRVQAGKRETRKKSPRLHRTKMQDQIMAAVQKNAAAESTPTPEPKIQAPSWMQAAPAKESQEKTSLESSRPVEQPQFTQQDQDVDLFESEFDVTRQALAQSQAATSKTLPEKKANLHEQKTEPKTEVNRPSASPAPSEEPRQSSVPEKRQQEHKAQVPGTLRIHNAGAFKGHDSSYNSTYMTRSLNLASIQSSETKTSPGPKKSESRRPESKKPDSQKVEPKKQEPKKPNPFIQLAQSMKNGQPKTPWTNKPFEPKVWRDPAPEITNSSPSQVTSRVIPRSAPASDVGDLNEEEERLLQQLLARRNKAPSVPGQPQPVQQSTAKPSSPDSGFESIFEDPDEVAREMLTSASKKRMEEEQAKKDEEEKLRQRNDDRPRFKITFNKSSPWKDEDDTSPDWKHLRPKQQSVRQQDRRESRSSPLSAEGIDARFEEHRRRRPRYGMFDINNVGYENKEQPTRRGADQTCVRCGEPGHFFANCPNPAKPGWVDRSGRRNRDATQTPRDFAQDSRYDRRDQGYTQPLRIVEERQDDEGLNETQDAATIEALEKEKARSARRSARFAEEEDEEVDEVKPVAKPRRSRFEGRDDDDDRPRKGRRSRFDEEDEFQADLGGVREARAERKQARQAKKDKAAKEAARQAARRARKAEEMTPINLPEFVTVSKLAQALSVRYEDFVEKMKELGFENTAHDEVITSENASLIAMEYNFDATIGNTEEAEAEERDLKPQPEPEDKDFLPARPPVVAIMGHVDHGKTTILDYLRKSSIAATEHGGITQHIGAFSVALSSGKTITFLDTPGHAAFLEMRKRGATVTDIIILVVAADDSVKPQTIEAIKHAQAANVPIIVAVNKIDKEEANVERVKQDLARYGVEIEDFGGDTQVVPVSGKTGQGIDELEDAAVTLSEILDHRADTDGPVEGWVLEATTKKAGRVATVLVRRGTLKPGSIIVAGKTWARVRSLRNEAGVAEMSAGPGTPIEVDGWRDQPNAGDEVLQAPNEQKASDVVDYRNELEERIKMAEDMETINVQRRAEQEKRNTEKEAAAASKARAATEGDDAIVREKPVGLTDAEESLGHQTVPFIIKADVSGSVEAVTAYLLQMSNPLCSPTVLRASVGPVSEFDIEHADAAGGHIIAFNLPSDPDSLGRATRKGIKLLEQNVIYRIVDDVKAVLEERLPVVKTQRVTGEAEVAMAFEIGVGGRKKLRIAGLKVRNGVVARGSRVRVTRGETRVYDGTVTSLKNVKKDVQEMRKGTECGMGFDGWEDFQVGDMIQTFEEKSEKRTLQI